LESFARGSIIFQFLRQKLQRNMPAELEIFRFVYHTHTAATEFLHDALVGDGLADHAEVIQETQVA
jgi:hypothetical protein